MSPDDGATSRKVIAAAMRVHSEIGPGLLESTYEACLALELRSRGHDVRTQVPVPIVYRGTELPHGLRLDLLIDDEIVVEVKTVEKLALVHETQLLTYLRFSHHRIGLLINFHTAHLRDGIKRMVNGWESGGSQVPASRSS